MREEGVQDLSLLKERFFVRELPDPPHIKEWCEIATNEEHKFIVLAAPRNHAKSETFSIDYPLQQIVKNPNVRIILVSNTASQAEGFLRSISANLEHNDYFKYCFGNLKPEKPEKWTDSQIIVKRSANYKDPTVSALGCGGPVLSKRADIIIVDDLLNFENTRTKEQRKKIKIWWEEVLKPVLNPGGRIIFVGTVWHKHDLLMDLLKSPEPDFKRVYGAIVSDSERKDLWDTYTEKYLDSKNKDRKVEAMKFYIQNKEEMDKGAKVLWKERFPYRKLYVMRKLNYTSFMKSYQNQIKGEGNSIFRDEVIDICKNENFRLVHELKEKMPLVTIGVDLASPKNENEKEDKDDNSLLSLGLLPDGRMIILNILADRWTPKDLKANVKSQIKNFEPNRVEVESNQFQNYFAAELVEDDKELSGVVIGSPTGKEKWDESIGVSSLAVPMENGKLIFPYDKSDPRTISLIDRLIEEMKEFPEGHTGDVLMSLWFAYRALRALLKGNNTGFLDYAKEMNTMEEEEEEISPKDLGGWVEMAKKQELN